jgi:hypothetical protein
MLFRQKFIYGDSPVQDPIAGAPLLRAMSAHSIAEALQDCFLEFLIFRLSSRDVFIMKQPVNVEEHNQHGLDIGTSYAALSFVEKMRPYSTGRTFALFPGHTLKPTIRHP